MIYLITQVIDCKAGGGKEITIGEMVKQFLTKLEWFDTRFPRIPVPVQKEISEYFEQMKKYAIEIEDVQVAEKNAEKEKRSRDRDSSRREKDRHHDRLRSHEKSRDRKRSRSPRGEKRKHHGSSKHDRRSDDRHRRRSRSRDRDQDRPGRSRYEDDYQNELKKFSEHRKKEKKHKYVSDLILTITVVATC